MYHHCLSLIWRWMGKHKNNPQQTTEFSGDKEQSEHEGFFPTLSQSYCHLQWTPSLRLAHTCWQGDALPCLTWKHVSSKDTWEVCWQKSKCLNFCVSSHTQLPEYWATQLYVMAEPSQQWRWHFLGQASTACSRHPEQPWAALLSLNSPELKGICKGDLSLISSLTQSCYFS